MPVTLTNETLLNLNVPRPINYTFEPGETRFFEFVAYDDVINDERIAEMIDDGQISIQGSGTVTSVAGKVGDVTLQSADITDFPAAVDALVPNNNVAAAADPGVNDDNTAGYGIGSTWYNQTGPAYWTCVDASTGAAVWDQVDLTL